MSQGMSVCLFFNEASKVVHLWKENKNTSKTREFCDVLNVSLLSTWKYLIDWNANDNPSIFYTPFQIVIFYEKSI